MTLSGRFDILGGKNMYDYAIAVLKKAREALEEELKAKVKAGGMTAPELQFNRASVLDITDALDTLESIEDEPLEGI